MRAASESPGPTDNGAKRINHLKKASAASAFVALLRDK
jgi:hypothetical protein